VSGYSSNVTLFRQLARDDVGPTATLPPIPLTFKAPFDRHMRHWLEHPHHLFYTLVLDPGRLSRVCAQPHMYGIQTRCQCDPPLAIVVAL